MTARLPSCIRCGGQTALHENDWADPPVWGVYCLDFVTCGIHMPERATQEEAIAAAHNRPLQAAMLAALKELLWEDSDKSEQAKIVTRVKAAAAIAQAEAAGIGEET